VLPTALVFAALLTATPSLAEPPSAEAVADEEAEGDAVEAPPPAPVVIPPHLEEVLVLPYPDDAPRGDGTVQVQVRLAIDETGAFVAAEVDQGAGEPFDQLALDTIRHTRFSPAYVDGVPTAVTIVVPVRFVLPAPAPPPPDSGVLVGKVREAGTRKLLTGVELTVEPAEGASPPTGPAPPKEETDRNGGFKFVELPVGTWTVIVSGPGIQTTRFEEVIEENLLRQVVYRVVPSHNRMRTVVRARRGPRATAERIVEGEWIRASAGSSGGFLRILESEAPIAPTPVLPTGLLPGAPMIRGMEGSDSVVLIDGVEAPLLYHFALLTTVVASDLIDHVRLDPGGSNVEYGDHTGGLIDVGLRTPRVDRFGGVIDISPIDAMAIFETPFGPPVSGFVSVRRSYVDAYLGELLPDDLPAEVTAMPVYADVTGMVNIDPGKGHRVAVSVISSSDKMEMTRTDDDETMVMAGLESGFTLIHGLWYSPTGGPVDSTVSVSYEFLKSRYTAFPDLYLDLREKRLQLRGTLGAALSSHARLRMGVEYRHRVLEYGENFFALPREDEPGLLNPYATTPDFEVQETPIDELGVFVRLPATVRDGVKLDPGVRLNLWSPNDPDVAVPAGVPITRMSVDPRFAARFKVAERWGMRSSLGLFHQVPSLEDLVQATDSALRSEAAFRGLVGVRWSPIPAVDLGLDVYLAGLWNLVVADSGLYDQALLGSLVELDTDGAQLLSNDGVGLVGGAELTLRWRPNSNVDCMVAYSLSRSGRRDHPGEDWRVFQYDRPHQLTLAGQVRLPKEWSFGLRFRLTSGAPDTPITDTIYLADLGGYVPQWGLPYSERLRPFHQLDWRVQKTIRARAFLLVVYLDVENTYFAQRDDVLIYNRDFTERLTFAMIPMFRLGLRTEF